MNLDELYNIIITSTNPQQTFKDNIDLWQTFYNERNYIIRKNIPSKQLYTIIEFLLQNENRQIFEYFTSNLLDSLTHEEEMLIFTLRNNHSNNKDDIGIILNTFDYHNNLISKIKELKIENDDVITKSSIDNYKSTSLNTDVLDALIMIIHKNFFEIDPKLVSSIVEYIEKEITILENKEKISLLDTNLIYQYFEKLIPINRYIGKNLKQSTIIDKIIKGEIQNKKIITKFLQKLNSKELLNVFDYDLNNFTNFLEKLDKVDESYKLEIMYQLIDIIIKKKEHELILQAIIKNNNNKYLKNCINDNLVKKTIDKLNKESPIFLEFSTIEYLLENDLVSEDFIYNLHELINTNSKAYTQEEIQKLSTKLSKYNKEEKIDYSFNECINIINKYLQNNIVLTKNQTKDIMKIIIKELNKYLELEDIEVYYNNEKDTNGSFCNSNKTIAVNINNKLIDDFLNTSKSIEERFQIFTTILHELRHHQQFSNKEKITYQDYIIKKEEELRKCDINYYEENYKIVEIEMDARLEGYNMLQKFIEKFFPNILNELQNSIIRKLNNELQLKESLSQVKEIEIIKKTNIDIQQAFDTLIRYNPKILEKEPIFKLEYHDSGLPKTIEDLLNEITEENKELIEEILEKRYSYKERKNQHQI